jgi:hypothetical protein
MIRADIVAVIKRIARSSTVATHQSHRLPYQRISRLPAGSGHCSHCNKTANGYAPENMDRSRND